MARPRVQQGMTAHTNNNEEKLLGLMTPPKTEKVADIAQRAAMTQIDTLNVLRGLREKGLVNTFSVDQEEDETLWRKL